MDRAPLPSSDLIQVGDQSTAIDVAVSRLECQGFVFDPVFGSTVVVTSPTGEQFYFRGGPAGGAGAGGSTEILLDATNGNEPANRSRFGPLVSEVDNYVRGTIDYTTQPEAVMTVGVTGASFESVVHALQDFSNRLNASEITYNPLSSNSNAAAHQAVTSLSMARPSPHPHVFAPGSLFVLPIP